MTQKTLFHLNEIKVILLQLNSNQKLLMRSKDLSENLILKLLCNVIFPSLPGQCEVPSFNPIQNGGCGKKARAASFSSITSTNLGISPQNILYF